MTFRAEPVDPRDVTQETDLPVYRVYFFDARRSTDEYRLVGAPSVLFAIDWAHRNAEGRDISLSVEYTDVNNAEGVGLARLLGPSIP